jgi:hypothetical protein
MASDGSSKKPLLLRPPSIGRAFIGLSFKSLAADALSPSNSISLGRSSISYPFGMGVVREEDTIVIETLSERGHVSSSVDHFSNPLKSFRLGRNKKQYAPSSSRSSVTAQLMELYGTKLWAQHLNHCIESIGRLDRETLVAKMKCYKEDAPNT